MAETLFQVFMDNDLVANHMNLTTALILIEALFNKYYNDNVVIMISRDKGVNNDSTI